MAVKGRIDAYGARAIAEAIRARRFSAVAAVEQRLEWIARRNPELNCFIAVFRQRALEEAEAVDAMIAAGRDPGPLAGVPFGVKDNYDVAGRITMAGSVVNRTLPPAREDAVLLQRLTRAGAVLLGTQNMDEFAYGFTTENAHYGATRNPRDPARSAGGSSGGSAAAVTAGLVAFSLGTDTNGSIRVPSSFCGIFGLKPTYGRLPRTGTFPFVHDLDHLGPLALGVEDLALVYDCLQGHDPGDAACASRPVEPTLPGIGGDDGALRIGLLGGWFRDKADAQGLAAVEDAARALGAVTAVELPGAAQARAAAFVLTAASGGNLHFEALKGQAAEFEAATRSRLLAGALLPANLVLQAQRVRHAFRSEIMRAFRHNDLLLAPATPCAAPLLGQPSIEIDGSEVPARPNIGVLTQPLSFVGLPIVAAPVPGGPMPIAIQIIAPPWREDLALRAAARLEALGIARAEPA